MSDGAWSSCRTGCRRAKAVGGGEGVGKDDSKHGRMTHRAHDPLNPATVYNTVPPHVAHTYNMRERYARVPFFLLLPTTLFKHFKRRGHSHAKTRERTLSHFIYII